MLRSGALGANLTRTLVPAVASVCLIVDAVFNDLTVGTATLSYIVMYLVTTMTGLWFLSRTPIWSLALDPAGGRADQESRPPARRGCCWDCWSCGHRGPLGRVATYDGSEGRAVETMAAYVTTAWWRLLHKVCGAVRHTVPQFLLGVPPLPAIGEVASL
jgi:hypothetical protein